MGHCWARSAAVNIRRTPDWWMQCWAGAGCWGWSDGAGKHLNLNITQGTVCCHPHTWQLCHDVLSCSLSVSSHDRHNMTMQIATARTWCMSTTVVRKRKQQNYKRHAMRLAVMHSMRTVMQQCVSWADGCWLLAWGQLTANPLPSVHWPLHSLHPRTGDRHLHNIWIVNMCGVHCGFP